MVRSFHRVALPSLLFLFLSSADAQDLPPELAHFESSSANPIFQSAPGKWDSLIRERGWIIKEQDQYKLWYTGYDPERKPLTMSLGYATSRDGVVWERYPGNPIVDDVWIEDVMIVQQNDIYYMFAEGAHDQAQLLTSSDGIRWKRVGQLDVRLTTGAPIPAGPFGTPTTVFHDNTWYLFYERRDQGIWLATSKDMQVWTNVNDKPLLLPGPDQYDELMVAMNQVIRHNSHWYAVMHGTGSPKKPRDWCTYLAVSDDLLTWAKCANGPVLPVSDNKSSGMLVHDGQRFRLYTMHAAVNLHVPAHSK